MIRGRKKGKKRSMEAKSKTKKKLHDNSRIPDNYMLRMEMELSKKGYVYGTARELSDQLRIPLRVIYKMISSKEFVSDKIRSGKYTYYIIKKSC